MHSTEWPEEYLIRKEVYIHDKSVYVVAANGYPHCLAYDGGIVDARWMGDAVVITYENGCRTRYFGPYGSQRESL